MHILLIILLLLVLIFGPQWWAQYTFRRYADVLEWIPGNGGELARHLLDQFSMTDVAVEKTEKGGDHYDPEDRVVRLSPDNYDHKSLTAVAVAAHEVGHAIQHQRKEAKFALRHRLVKVAQTTQQLGAGAMFLLIGLLYERTHTRDIRDFRSLVRTTPRFAFFTIFTFIAAIGMPGTAAIVGRVSSFLLTVPTFGNGT